MSRVTFHKQVLLVLLLYLNLTTNLRVLSQVGIQINLYTGYYWRWSTHIISTAKIVPHISIRKLDFHLSASLIAILSSVNWLWVIGYSRPCFHCWILPWPTCKAGCVACVELPTSIVITCMQNFNYLVCGYYSSSASWSPTIHNSQFLYHYKYSRLQILSRLP